MVMKWTGHPDSQAMKHYIEIAEKTKADAMKLFEQAMEKSCLSERRECLEHSQQRD